MSSADVSCNREGSDISDAITHENCLLSLLREILSKLTTSENVRTSFGPQQGA